MTASTDGSGQRRILKHLERVRRGWVFRDDHGCGWWVDDTVFVNGAHRVVTVGHSSAQYRVFTPMVGAREGNRRVYRFADADEHRLSVRVVERQLASASTDRPALT